VGAPIARESQEPFMNAIKRRTKTPTVPAAGQRDAPNDAEVAHPVGTGLGAAAGGAAAGALIGSMAGAVGTAVGAAAGAVAGAVGGRKLAEMIQARGKRRR
jgi:predicted lipid-binding transport protein (Tim44 family)